MTAGPDDEFWDDLFHACALAAFLEQATAVGNWPDSEATRQRAYDLYEQALTDRSRRGDEPNRASTAEAFTLRSS